MAKFLAAIKVGYQVLDAILSFVGAGSVEFNVYFKGKNYSVTVSTKG